MPARSFVRVFFGSVAELGQLRVAEQGVVVEADLGVEGDQLAGFGDDERVDFDQAAIERRRTACRAAFMNFSAERTLGPVRSSFAAQLADLVRLQAGVGAEGFFEDQLGRFGGDLFDVHAACAARP